MSNRAGYIQYRINAQYRANALSQRNNLRRGVLPPKQNQPKTPIMISVPQVPEVPMVKITTDLDEVKLVEVLGE